MFRLFFVFAAVLIYAEDWTHHTRQNEVRDAVLADNGTLWAAFAWGLQERLANKTENNYMPGNNNLEAADFVQIFALPGGDIIAASRNGNLVRKNKNSKNFGTISNSYAEKKRELLPRIGKRANNILILPFKGALAFFDYEQEYSIITLYQIGTSSLESFLVKRIAIAGDSLWIKFDETIWKRKIDWNKISEDRFLAEPNSWEKTDKIPEGEAIYDYVPTQPDFPLENVRIISVLPGTGALAWGNSNFSFFSRMQNEWWGEAFRANTKFGYDQEHWPAKSLVMHPSGNFAVGFWGAGLLTYDASYPKANLTGWFHPANPATNSNSCPTSYRDDGSDDNWTIVHGVSAVPDFSGFLFSFFSGGSYGLGFVDVNNNQKAECFKPPEASSTAASSIITRKSEAGDWEIYVAWKSSMYSKDGGVDFYKTNPYKFSPVWQNGWTLPFGSPIDFAFDSKGILWAVSNSKVFYLAQNEWKEPSYIKGFEGGIISALETDAQNGLWIGTEGNGAYLLSKVNNSPDSLIAKHFRIKNGLLNEMVYDIAIDTVKGKVYFAHDLGLSVYSTAIVRNISNYMQSDAPKPIAYPNPFRPKQHNAVTIDYISEKSTVYIFDSSGKRVRFFNTNELRGGAAVWDGKSESGKLVAPGLYHYMVKDGKKTAKGKIMVER
ncbi:hypothetical protein R83H12_00264 [Fibrobacteria bacterium R8-3-H12]